MPHHYTGKESNLKVEGRESIYILLADMPEAKLLGNPGGYAGGAYQQAGQQQMQQMQPAAMQVQVPVGVAPGLVFRVDCGKCINVLITLHNTNSCRVCVDIIRIEQRVFEESAAVVCVCGLWVRVRV